MEPPRLTWAAPRDWQKVDEFFDAFGRHAAECSAVCVWASYRPPCSKDLIDAFGTPATSLEAPMKILLSDRSMLQEL